MRGHFEYFDDECFWIEDDPWFPWGDIYCLRQGDELRLLCGENAGEIVTFSNINDNFELKGNGFCIDYLEGMEVEWIKRGDNHDY